MRKTRRSRVPCPRLRGHVVQAAPDMPTKTWAWHPTLIHPSSFILHPFFFILPLWTLTPRVLLLRVLRPSQPLRCAGSRAWQLLRELFHPRSDAGHGLPEGCKPGRIWLGRLGGNVADDVVLVVKSADPTPWLELHGHGGREVVRYLLDTLEDRGAKICSWQQFMATGRQAGSGSGLSLSLQIAAAVALAHAKTTRTAAILLDQYQGAFERAIQEIITALECGDVDETDRLLTELSRHAGVGRHLTTPWRVTIAGAANVGKSSLLNALAGYQRSIVAPSPGTTRDVVTTVLSIDGWPVELADTAGQRRPRDPWRNRASSGLARLPLPLTFACGCSMEPPRRYGLRSEIATCGSW